MEKTHVSQLWIWVPVGFAVSTAVGIWAVLEGRPSAAEFTALTQPEDLQADEGAPYLPWGNESPTYIAIQNDGDNPGLIQAISYTIDREKPTPKRVANVRAFTTIVVDFHDSHFDERKSQFVKGLKPPVQVDAREFAHLCVVVVQPRKKGTSYLGTLKVDYDNGETLLIKGVELDELGDRPADPL